MIKQLKAIAIFILLLGSPAAAQFDVSGSVASSVLTLRLKDPSTAKRVTYLKESAWNQDTLLRGTNGIAALTFCEVPVID